MDACLNAKLLLTVILVILVPRKLKWQIHYNLLMLLDFLALKCMCELNVFMMCGTFKHFFLWTIEYCPKTKTVILFLPSVFSKVIVNTSRSCLDFSRQRFWTILNAFSLCWAVWTQWNGFPSSGILIICVMWRGKPNTVTALPRSTDYCGPMDRLFGLLGEETSLQSCVVEKSSI